MFKTFLRRFVVKAKARLGIALNPLTVNAEAAASFFRNLQSENVDIASTSLLFSGLTGTVFDIGANCGYWSKYFMQQGFKGRVVLFEPIPNLLEIAVKNLADIQCEKIFVNAAVSGSAGELVLSLPTDGNIGWITSVAEKSDKGASSIAVSAVCGGDYIALFKPEFVKIDVEGYEAVVLGQFAQFIDTSYKPAFLVELGWGVSNPMWSDFLALARQFVEWGYCFYDAKSLAEMSLSSLQVLDRTVDVFISSIPPGSPEG